MIESPHILCFIGSSGSGKTTLMEGVIEELSRRGYRVATIKHTHHSVELDQPGKDSWRHRKAGAKVSILSSPRGFGVFSEVDQELTLEELCKQFIHEVDLILVEGYKESNYPKILVAGDGRMDSFPGVKAVVSDKLLDPDALTFQPTDLKGICEFIEREFLGRRE